MCQEIGWVGISLKLAWIDNYLSFWMVVVGVSMDGWTKVMVERMDGSCDEARGLALSF